MVSSTTESTAKDAKTDTRFLHGRAATTIAVSQLAQGKFSFLVIVSKTGQALLSSSSLASIVSRRRRRHRCRRSVRESRGRSCPEHVLLPLRHSATRRPRQDTRHLARRALVHVRSLIFSPVPSTPSFSSFALRKPGTKPKTKQTVLTIGSISPVVPLLRLPR